MINIFVLCGNLELLTTTTTTTQTFYGEFQDLNAYVAQIDETLRSDYINATASRETFLNQTYADTLYKNINETGGSNFTQEVADTLYMPLFSTSNTCLGDYFLSAYFNSKVPTGTIKIYSTCVGQYFCEWYSCNTMTGIEMVNVQMLGDNFCGNGSCGAVTSISLPSLTRFGNNFCKFAGSCGAVASIVYPNITIIGNYFCSNGGCPGALTIAFENVTTIGVGFCFASCRAATSLSLPLLTTVGNDLGGATSFTALKSIRVLKSIIYPLSMDLSGCNTTSTFACSGNVAFTSISSVDGFIILVCSASTLTCT